MRLPRRTRYSVVDPTQDRNGGLVIGQARNRGQAHLLAKAFAKAFGSDLWVVKTR
jgi:hypothetical protein